MLYLLLYHHINKDLYFFIYYNSIPIIQKYSENKTKNQYTKFLDIVVHDLLLIYLYLVNILNLYRVILGKQEILKSVLVALGG